MVLPLSCPHFRGNYHGISAVPITVSLSTGYRMLSLKQLSHAVMHFHHQVWYHMLSLRCACVHPHPIGYPCAKFRFFHGFHCWASPWRRITYSITQLLTQSLTQLIWCPGNQSFCFGTTDILNRELHGDGDCRRQMSWDSRLWWNKTVRDSRKHVFLGIPAKMYFYLTFMVHLQQHKFVFKPLSNVFSDFTEQIGLLSVNGVAARKAHSLGGASSNSVLHGAREQVVYAWVSMGILYWNYCRLLNNAYAIGMLRSCLYKLRRPFISMAWA